MTMETYHWERQHLTDPPTTLSIMRTLPDGDRRCGVRIGRFLQSSPPDTTDLSLRCVRQTNS
jgi:hypothetical protein